MTLPRSSENWSGFWGLPQMTKSFEIKRLKTHRVFNLLAPFATSWRKVAFWGLAPFALLTHDSGSKKIKGSKRCSS
jgi:hypothetical protein